MQLPLLEMGGGLYAELIRDLAKSGGGVAESGAFLLGKAPAGPRCIDSYLLYEKVAPQSRRQHDYVAFTAEETACAWDYCYRHSVQVLADVHTHPGSPRQSPSDRAHPIVSLPGHVALIVPDFALRKPAPSDLGVHVFLGQGRWRSLFGREAAQAVHLT